MSSALNPRASPVTSGRANALKTWLPIALFAILWVDLCRQLSYTWDTNEQYAYGWFVPLLAIGLFLRRWPNRPEGTKEESRKQKAEINFYSLLSICLLCLLLLPLRVIIEINQDWPLITWPYTIIVVALTLYAIHLADPSTINHQPSSDVRDPWSVVSGPWSVVSSPWLCHFAFAICFILVAVQWPYRIEHSLTQNLMQIVASLTVEIIGWFGIPAIQQGNLIEVSTGVLGVDEACSGIRSFQSTLMAALFLGELYLLRVPIRLLLIVAGLGAAFLLNVCRTLILTWQANAHGLSAIDKWHDPAGFTIAIACFGVLWLLVILIKKCWPIVDSEPSASSYSASDGERAGVRCNIEPSSPSTINPSDVSGPVVSSPSSVVSSPVVQPTRYLIAVGCWSLLCLFATEVWYRSHSVRRADTAQWWVSYPTNLPSFKTVTVSKAAAKLLKHDVESGGSWDEPDGAKWSVFCFRWKEGSPTARMSAQGHRPEYCLVGSGHDLISMSGTQFLPANGIALPFRLYNFDRAERPMHVFFALWEDGAESQPGFGKTKQGDRLRTVWAGRRGMGQQTLEIICNGYADMATAELAVRKRLPELVRIESHEAAVAAKP